MLREGQKQETNNLSSLPNNANIFFLPSQIAQIAHNLGLHKKYN